MITNQLLLAKIDVFSGVNSVRSYDRFMKRIGYARVSSTGQSLDVQLSKLKEASCDRIFQEKRITTSASRPEFQNCMNYLREGDTLVVTRLDRLARSVIHLSELSQRFERENINFIAIDQNIDTSDSTGSLMFNMLACIAEFENDLRRERQVEGISKAKEKGIKFGRPAKLTDETKQAIFSRRLAGVSIGEIRKEFGISKASIYRVVKECRTAKAQLPCEPKTTKINLWLQVENNSKFVRGKGKSRQEIENYYLSDYDCKKLSKDGWEYELTFQYTDDEDLERQIYELANEMESVASLRNGFTECSFVEVGTDRSWL